VLVVDDEPIMRALIAATLSAENYDIIEAGGGAEALTLTASHHPTLLILDARIPAPDGFTVCEEIKHDPALAATLVIMVTANASDEPRAVQAGADGYLSKPFSPLGLLNTIDGLLAQWAPA
jgi:CheY-like chemotaxis protein